MKKRLGFVLVLLGMLTILTGCFNETPETIDFANAVITIDINPSIELKTNEEGLIVKVKAINEEAKNLLEDLELVGLTIDDALDLIVEQASLKGYLEFDVDNAILISLCKEGENKEDIKEQLKEKLQKQLRKNYHYGEVICDDSEIDEELIAEAEELGVSVGKLKHIKKVLEIDSELTLEELLELSVKELNDLLKPDENEKKEQAQKRKEQFEEWLEEKEERKEKLNKKKQERANKEEKPEKEDRPGNGEGKEERPEKEDRPGNGEDKEERPEKEDRPENGEGKEERPEKEDCPGKEERPEKKDRPGNGEDKEERPEKEDRPGNGEGKEERPEKEDCPGKEERPEKKDRPENGEGKEGKSEKEGHPRNEKNKE